MDNKAKSSSGRLLQFLPYLAYFAVAVGAVIRVLIIVFMTDVPEDSGPDSAKYILSAREYLSQGIFADTELSRLLPPGYPWFIAVIDVVAASNAMAIMVFHTLLFYVSLVFFAIGLRRIVGRATVLLFVSFMSLSSLMVDVSTSIMYESIIVSFFLITVVLYLRQQSEPQWHLPSSVYATLTVLLMTAMAALQPSFAPFIVVCTYIFLTPVTGNRVVRAAVGVIAGLSFMLLASLRMYVARGELYGGAATATALSSGLGREWSTNVSRICPDLIDLEPKFSYQHYQVNLACVRDLVLLDPLRWASNTPAKILEAAQPAFVSQFDEQGKSFEQTLLTGPRSLQVVGLVLMIVSVVLAFVAFRSNKAYSGLSTALATGITWFMLRSIIFFGLPRYFVTVYVLVFLGLAQFVVGRAESYVPPDRQIDNSGT